MISIRIAITPTERYAVVDGSSCQVWEGITGLGSRCVVYVRWIDVPHGQDNREFDALPTRRGETPTIIDLPVTRDEED